MPEWINVEDHLPTLLKSVWVFGAGQAIIGHRVEKPPVWRTDLGRWEIWDVTHWQPIVAPDPPCQMFVGSQPKIGGTLKIGESCMGTPMRIEFDTETMDG
jgi:hypothetical protein